MSSTSRAWIAALGVGAVQAMRYQGLFRWNHTIRSIHLHAKNNLRSLSQSKQLSSSAFVSSRNKAEDQEKLKEAEDSLRKVMYLSCWGPN